jgi:hypothetical protein
MSKNRDKAKKVDTGADKRAADIRRALLIVHVILEVVLIVGVCLTWWSVGAGADSMTFAPGLHLRDEALYPFTPDGHYPFTTEARYLIVAMVVCFFCTSYDLVANLDIQWAPLLLSAFALGVTGETCWKLDGYFDMSMKHVVQLQVMRKLQESPSPAPPSPAPTASAVASVGSTTGSVAPVTTAQAVHLTENLPVARVEMGLKLVLFASASMALISTYLTFFARRAT